MAISLALTGCVTSKVGGTTSYLGSRPSINAVEKPSLLVTYDGNEAETISLPVTQNIFNFSYQKMETNAPSQARLFVALNYTGGGSMSITSAIYNFPSSKGTISIDIAGFLQTLKGGASGTGDLFLAFYEIIPGLEPYMDCGRQVSNPVKLRVKL